jgi:hypothetical protein
MRRDIMEWQESYSAEIISSDPGDEQSHIYTKNF